MRRCLQLANNGLGTTYPNPLVGSVVVHKDTIIGEGWHQRAGTLHAEVHAIAAVKDPQLLGDSTLYVNLEPCSHFGKTPPCADLIIDKKIPRVVVGCSDPNPLVAGKGIRRLREAGIEVVADVLARESREINRRFFVNQLHKRPYVILKWAESADGFIAPVSKNSNRPVYLSSAASRQLVHKWRTEEDGILVGAGTVLADDPLLDARDWNGQAPVKIVLDRSGKIHGEARLFSNGKSIVFSKTQGGGLPENAIFENARFEGRYLEEVLERLNAHGISSVLVEGGRAVLQAFIGQRLWDEARVFRCPTALENGILAPDFNASCLSRETVSGDGLYFYRNYDRHDNL